MASAPTSARVRAIIFFIDWILPRPKCANWGAHTATLAKPTRGRVARQAWHATVPVSPASPSSRRERARPSFRRTRGKPRRRFRVRARDTRWCVFRAWFQVSPCYSNPILRRHGQGIITLTMPIAVGIKSGRTYAATNSKAMKVRKVTPNTRNIALRRSLRAALSSRDVGMTDVVRNVRVQPLYARFSI